MQIVIMVLVKLLEKKLKKKFNQKNNTSISNGIADENNTLTPQQSTDPKSNLTKNK